MSGASDFVSQLVGDLRRAGVTVPLGASIALSEAIAALAGLPAADGASVYWAGRSTLICRHEDLAVYDAVFHHRVGHRRADTIPLAPDAEHSSDDGHDGGDHRGERSDDIDIVRFSAAETLRHKDFSDYSDAERAAAGRMMSELRLAGPLRRAARLRAHRRRGDSPDPRATMRASLRAGGEPVVRHWRSRTTKLRRIVLLLDVSGSMDTYARALLRFVHAAVAGRQRVEAFTFGTRLTRVTRELSSRDPDVALRRASATVEDWSGGTRLGESLRAFNDRWGVRGMARGAVVVILSDGWDRGDPAVLGEQMARLQRVAHRMVWVNPLKVTPGYAPLARGMAAALPHVDAFVEGHSVAAMERLLAEISA